ncbi:hypothetical protein GGH92_006125, partial [Coemansia sp. RSA 2673]
MSSLFQTLPRSIVEKIVYYVTDSSRQLFSGTVVDLGSRPELLIPLLWACHGYRDIVYSQYSAEYGIHISRTGVFGEWSAWPPGLRKVVSPSLGLVSKLEIIVDLHSVLSGSALLDCVFPVAHSLTCVITGSSEDGAMTDLFVERVRRMVPMVREIKVIVPGRAGIFGGGDHFGCLVSGLGRLVRH